MKKKRIVILIFFLVVGAGAWWYFRRVNAPPSYETTQVVRGDLRETVSASATLVAEQEIDLNFEMTGRIASVSVKVGEDVAAGEPVARLESKTLDGQIASAKAAVDRASAESLLREETTREASRAQRDAKLYYESVKSAADQERKAADAAYQNAKDYESDAKKYYEGVVDARGEDSSESRSAKLTLTTAVNARKSADEARKTIEKNRESSVTAAKNAWSAAREKVETLTSSGQRLLETSALRSAEAAYAVSLENGKRAAIVAPVNGKIVKLNYEEGEVVGTSIASPFGKLLSYDLLLEVKVPESDVTRLRSGMGATVSFDAFEEGDTVLAEVISVEPDATVIQDVVYYIAKLRLSNRDERLKPGMTGDADIHISEKRGVLLLPERLLKESGETKQARVLLPDARVETRMVTTGLRGDDGMIEILSGLSENDAIISDAEKR